MNIAGALVILVGGVLLVIGLRGTQHAALPGLFPAASAATPAPTAPPTSISQMPIVAD